MWGNMRILFCIGCMNKGGAERVIANLANYFSNQNEVAIAITIKDTSKYELDKNISFYTLDQEKNVNTIIIKNIKRINKLNSIINEFKPDIIVSFLPEPSYRVLTLRILKKIPVIVSVRNDPKIEYKSFINKIMMKILYPLADGFVFQTEEAKKYFSKKIQKKSIIIPNPLKEEYVTREKYFGKREKTIVTVGRLEEQKNHELLINAFKELEKEINGYKLIIYGDGSLRTKLEKQIEELQLNEKVILYGEIEDIPNKIEKASVFVLPSKFEGMPNALMEAMALGIPCIATDCPCGGVRDLIVHRENGFLISNNNLDELKKAIRYVINNPKEASKYGNNAIKICLKYNPKKINNLWKQFIQKIKKGENNEDKDIKA